MTVDNGAAPLCDITPSGVPATIARGQMFTARGNVANTGGGAAGGYTVPVSFTPSDSMKLQSPPSSSQSVPAVSAGGTQTVSWPIRAEREGTATLTMTLRDASGTTVDTVSQTVVITN